MLSAYYLEPCNYYPDGELTLTQIIVSAHLIKDILEYLELLVQRNLEMIIIEEKTADVP